MASGVLELAKAALADPATLAAARAALLQVTLADPAALEAAKASIEHLLAPSATDYVEPWSKQRNSLRNSRSALELAQDEVRCRVVVPRSDEDDDDDDDDESPERQAVIAERERQAVIAEREALLNAQHEHLHDAVQ